LLLEAVTDTDLDEDSIPGADSPEDLPEDPVLTRSESSPGRVALGDAADRR
jgi:hypothetical protein